MRTAIHTGASSVEIDQFVRIGRQKQSSVEQFSRVQSASVCSQARLGRIKLCKRVLFSASAGVMLLSTIAFFGFRGESAPVLVGHELRETFLAKSSTSNRLELLQRLTLEQKREMARQVHFVSEVIKEYNSKIINPEQIARAIVRQSRLANVDPLFVAAVIKNESGFKNFAVSNRGAVGLMQLMPDTARYISNQIESDWQGFSQLADPEYNIRLGIAYIKYLERYFGGDRENLLAAYNWGPANVIDALKGGRPVLGASKSYARKIIRDHQNWQNDFQVRLAQYRYMNLDHLVG